MCLRIHNIVLKKDPKNKYMKYVNETISFYCLNWDPKSMKRYFSSKF